MNIKIIIVTFCLMACFGGLGECQDIKDKKFKEVTRINNKEGKVIIKGMPVGPIMANCFIIGCEETKLAAVIDPGDEASEILKALAEEKLSLQYIINTHGHFDHVGANKKLKEVTGAEILIHSKDAPMLSKLSVTAAAFGLRAENSPGPDREVSDGDIISFGKVTLKVIHTPGHTPGGISILTGNHLFSGDTLFAGSIGRTDLPGGDYETLISTIRKKIFTLDEKVIVHPGHGPDTRISDEKIHNPFVGEGRKAMW